MLLTRPEFPPHPSPATAPRVLYVSFFTPAYAGEARGLVESLDRFHLPHDVLGQPDRGGWQRNTQHKATFVGSMMHCHPGRPIVWVDADARLRRLPLLLDSLTCDFAAHWKPAPPESPKPPELLSGTMYFSGSEACADLVGDWIDECARHLEDYDQLCLDRVVHRLPGVEILNLPPEYTAIFDADMGGPDGPVFEHLQASRRLKS